MLKQDTFFLFTYCSKCILFEIKMIKNYTFPDFLLGLVLLLVFFLGGGHDIFPTVFMLCCIVSTIISIANHSFLSFTSPYPYHQQSREPPVGKRGLGWGKSKNERLADKILVETMLHSIKTVGKMSCKKEKKITNLT